MVDVPMENQLQFSDYIVYVDESGDHGLASINPQYPVFVLAFCIFEKVAYRNLAVPAVQALKFEFWGHDGVVLHSHEIRKSKGDFNILLNETVRNRFIERMNSLIENMPVTIIAAVIDKARLVRRYANPHNPYEIALRFCMERLRLWANDRGQRDRLMHILVEKRGAAEDASLELEFRRIADGENHLNERLSNLAIRFMDKKHNSSGLQIADLVAYPIGRHVIQPGQPNRAFDLLKPKIRSGPQERYLGYGLKTFP